jgi:type VI secretion system secreted protein VgrG
MSDAIVQTGRLLSLSSPLGADVLIPVAFDGEEGVSRLFRFTIDAVAKKDSIAPADLLGKSVTLSIARQGGTARKFNGMVRAFWAGAMAGREHRHYKLELVPDLWKLTRTSDCRIFQEKTAVEIIETLLGDGGVSNFKKQGVSGTHNARDYCVQYRETDFAFISRLMEEEGIYYYFTHEDGKHTLVLSDSASGYGDGLDASLQYAASVQGAEQALFGWRPGYAFQSGKWTLDDYDFEAPGTDLQASTSTVLSISAFKSWERYDYPGEYTKKADGTNFSRLLMEADEADYQVCDGESGYRGLGPGLKFTLAGHPVAAEQGKAYVPTLIRHQASDNSHVGNQREPPRYSNSFSAVPAATIARPQRLTPKPIVQGPQTAVVTGPSGEEIYTDKYGRIRVKFHWDRLGKSDETSSCYVRTAQIMAGKNWGAQFIPRIGMEVVVSFLEGDPDRPLVVGCVYNGDNLPPYTLPDNKTQSGFKSRSSTKGDAAMFNELRFEDKKDSEEIYFHAQKDFKRMVENDDTLQVDNDQTITIKNNRSLTVSDGDETIKISSGNRTTTISTGNESLTVSKGKRDTTISKGNETLTVGEGNRTVTVSKGNDAHTVSKGNRTVTVSEGNDTLTVTKGNETVDVKQGDYSLKLGMGNVSIKADAGKATIEAMQSIELKVGANSVKIDTTGVTIKGTMVTITGDAQCQIKGAMATVQGDGTLTLKGGVVMIN